MELLAAITTTGNIATGFAMTRVALGNSVGRTITSGVENATAADAKITSFKEKTIFYNQNYYQSMMGPE